MKDKIIITSIIGVTLVSCVTISVSLIINYKKDRTSQLNICITDAKTERENLWDANCEIADDGECYINDMETAEWIDARHEQELWNCFRLYD